MPPEPLDTEGRMWRWLGQSIDLGDDQPHDGKAYAPNVRAAILAHRDASTPEEEDAAVYLVWSTEEHPPTENGPHAGCRTCRTDKPCAEQDRAFSIANQFLLTKSMQLVHRSRRRLAEVDRARKARTGELMAKNDHCDAVAPTAFQSDLKCTLVENLETLA
jgi:hypothetical protein